MNYFLKILFFFLFLCLFGCVFPPKTILKKQEVKHCLTLCAERFDSCKNTCVNNCSVCSVDAKQTAQNSYAHYIHEERVESGYIMRRLQSYRDPLQCRKITCNCYDDVATCEQSCTGIIQKQLRSVPYCT